MRNARVRVLVAMALLASVAAPNSATPQQIEPLQRLLLNAGILDKSILSQDVNRSLEKLHWAAFSAKTPAAARRASEALDQEIHKAVEPYRSYQRCAAAVESRDEDAKDQYCTESALTRLEGSIDEVKLQNLCYTLELCAAPGGKCDNDQRVACQVECFGKPRCRCCREQ